MRLFYFFVFAASIFLLVVFWGVVAFGPLLGWGRLPEDRAFEFILFFSSFPVLTALLGWVTGMWRK